MLPTCFPHSPPRSPTKSGAASRLGSRCRRDTHQPGDSVEELSGGTGTVQKSFLEELMADLQLQQQDPVIRPVLAAWPANPSNMKECSTRVLVQQYPRRFLRNGILRRGQADHRRGTLEQLILPSSLRPDVPREVRDYISSCDRCTVVPCLGKRKGI